MRKHSFEMNSRARDLTQWHPELEEEEEEKKKGRGRRKEEEEKKRKKEKEKEEEEGGRRKKKKKNKAGWGEVKGCLSRQVFQASRGIPGVKRKEQGI